MSSLVFEERSPEGAADGLVILHHGRGADEHDLIGLADLIDPQRRLHFVTPGGPLQVPGWSGKHWYLVPRVGFPERDSFQATYRTLARFHDETWERTGIGPERTVFGGFSMGSVMSYSMGLAANRPRVAGLLIFSGFIPTVDGWSADLPAVANAGTRVFIAHGREDQVIDVSFARQAHALLDASGVANEYREGDFGHRINSADVPGVVEWLAC